MIQGMMEEESNIGKTTSSPLRSEQIFTTQRNQGQSSRNQQGNGNENNEMEE